MNESEVSAKVWTAIRRMAEIAREYEQARGFRGAPLVRESLSNDWNQCLDVLYEAEAENRQ